MLNDQARPISSHSSRYACAYFEMFVLAAMFIWLPFKAAAYAAPWVCMGWFILRASSGGSLIRLIGCIFIFALIILAYIFFYSMVEEKFVTQNAILFLFTYSSFLIFPVLPANVGQEKYLPKYLNVIGWLLLFESVLGILQVFIFIGISGGNLDRATGDIAQGTLSPLSFLYPAGNFNNQIFTCNILLLLLFYLPHAIVHRRGRMICAISAMAILISSVMHLLVAVLGAVAIVTLFFTRSFLKFSLRRLLITVVLAIFLFFLALTQPRNLSLFTYYYDEMASSPKFLVTVNSFFKLPQEYPWVYVIGLGPGQYSSRASLIGTGKYFVAGGVRQDIPGIEPNSSKAFGKYVNNYWDEVSQNPKKYGNSTMARPFYSLLSVQIEMGMLVFGGILFFTLGLLVKLRNSCLTFATKGDRLKVLYTFSLGIVIGYLWLISAFENYLEVPHAIFLSLVLSKYYYAFLFRRENAVIAA
jgi:hypothetical protein